MSNQQEPIDERGLDTPSPEIDHHAESQRQMEEAAKYPPLETADLDNGPDDEMFNAGNGIVTTRLRARTRRDRLAEIKRLQRPVTYEEAVAAIPDHLHQKALEESKRTTPPSDAN